MRRAILGLPAVSSSPIRLPLRLPGLTTRWWPSARNDETPVVNRSVFTAYDKFNVRVASEIAERVVGHVAQM
jgi:hypothetical protein